MKRIKVKWCKDGASLMHGMSMYVVESDHPRFSVGTRFDFGFFMIATREGYEITSCPAVTVKESLLDELKQLDPNGWCIATDGSMDDLSEAEQIEELYNAIKQIKEEA